MLGRHKLQVGRDKMLQLILLLCGGIDDGVQSRTTPVVSSFIVHHRLSVLSVLCNVHALNSRMTSHRNVLCHSVSHNFEIKKIKFKVMRRQ